MCHLQSFENSNLGKQFLTFSAYIKNIISKKLFLVKQKKGNITWLAQPFINIENYKLILESGLHSMYKYLKH
jgi:hypothetical protein